MRKRGLVPFDPEQVLDLARTAKVEADDWFTSFFRAAAISQDPGLTQKICEILHPLAIDAMLEDIPFRDPTEEELRQYHDCSDPIFIGRFLNALRAFAISIQLFAQHVLLLGGTGTGKTNAIYGMALQARRFCNVWLIDKDKQDYRHLVRMWPGLRVFDVQKTFIFNPWQPPPGVHPKDHRTSAVMTFLKSNNLLDGSESLLLRIVNNVYLARGIYDGSQDYPTTFDICAALDDLRINRYSREAGFRDSLKNRFDAYLSISPQTLSYSHGYSIPDLEAMSFVLEVKGLPERQIRCFASWLFSATFQYRIANNMRGRGLRTLVGVDECKYLVPPGYNQHLGFSPIASLLAQCREVGLGFLFADQTAQLEETVYVQSRTKLCMRLGSGEDIEKVRKTLALTKEQAAYITRLDVGEAIVRVPQLDPFLIRFPKVRLG